MAKKKSAATENKVNKNKEAEIIVLNQGQTIDVEALKEAERKQLGGEEMGEVVDVIKEGQDNEELDILGGSDEEDVDVVIDTTHLDEELNMTDIFEESGVTILSIGSDKESKKDKKKHKEGKGDKSENKDKELSKQVLEVFTMVLKGKDFEPIPYPFGDNDGVYDLAFDQCVEAIDHMAVSKFSRNNPTLTLKDAFRHVFTVAEETEVTNEGDKKVEKRKSEELIKPADVKPIEEVVDTEEISNEVKEVTVLQKKVKELFEAFAEEVEIVLLKVLAHDDEDAEKVNKVLIESSEEVEKQGLGKLIKKVTGVSFADIIRAEINGDDTTKEKFKTRMTELSGRISANNDKLNKTVTEDMDMDEFIKLLECELLPDVSNMTLTQIIRERKVLVPDMSNGEFAKWVVDIRQARKNDTCSDKKDDKVVEPKKEEKCEETYDNTLDEKSAKFTEAVANARSIFDRLNTSFNI